MSAPKFQINRANPCKPSIVKEYGLWWVKVYDKSMKYQVKSALTHAEVLEMAGYLVEGAEQ